ncbi:cyclodeaminase/cyclohydrolase family protein [Endozoicomonas sp. G2_2]|uniref:cyclodeaminase/cyclohydrolase family protein n=1 Tax=Endozoicomonas sp. G2_2 TaxID=2821092 RepID=UPI001ADD3886|nr:cyclodeaminase/cyclohydrolase family protein [Endozoicomonas sp. G2_2]MBO9470548.1 cyclodeaminase/cyclohydrolase family protein [Endozoicomonas sp. G2_2]
MSMNESLAAMTLGEFRDDIESRAMPGCGAVAANAAANGLSLALKGLRLSKPRDGSQTHANLIERADVLIDELGGYADEDVAAFQAYLAARKQAGEDEHSDALDAAIERINQVPLATARACRRALELTLEANDHTRAALQSDTRAGAQLLHAGLCMVLLNVDANIDGLDDEAEQAQLREERHELQRRADALLARLADASN